MHERINVLVVDDESVWRENYETGIRGLDIDSIRTVSNLADARRAIDDIKFAAAIVDIGLDTSDETNVEGLLVMEKLRSADDDTSIVVITGRSGSDVIDVVSKSIREYGAVATFAKGKVDPLLLRGAVTNGLQVHADKVARSRRPAHREIPHLQNHMVWEDQMMRVLGISEGVTLFYEFLERLLRPYLPLVGTDEVSALDPDRESGVAYGAYWSRAIGRPIVVGLGRKAAIDKTVEIAGRLHGRYEVGEILADCTMGKIRGTVHELKDYNRSRFNRAHS